MAKKHAAKSKSRRDRQVQEVMETTQPMRGKSARLRASEAWTRNEAKPLVCKTPAQKEYLAYMRSKPITGGIGPAGTGKAQPLDALVHTPSGWVTMGEINVGDIVSTPDGRQASVSAVHPQGQKDIYRITFEDGRQTECCLEHLWKVFCYEWGRNDNENGWRVMDTSRLLTLLDKPAYRKRLYVPLSLAVERVEHVLILDPYLVGIILGDGCLRAEGAISLSSADEQILDNVRATLPENYELRHRSNYDYSIVHRDGRNGARVNPILNAFREMSLTGLLSKDKFIPQGYLSASIGQRRALLQGLFDSDGTVDIHGAVSFSTTSCAMARQVQYLIRSLGGIAKIAPKQTYCGEVICNSYHVSVRIKNPSQLFRLERKIARLPEKGQYEDGLKLRIKSIELVGQKEAKCISIDNDDHLYLTDEFTVTHNTYVSVKYAAQQLDERNKERIIFVRPIVEVGETLGFLKGGVEEKIDPYLTPILDVLEEHYGKSHVENMMTGWHPKVLFVPLQYLRGRTFKEDIVILDEAQNATCEQMETFLTRIGDGAQYIIQGDLNQCDLKDRQGRPIRSGLLDAIEILEGMDQVGIKHFVEEDIVRSGLCREIAIRYRQRRIQQELDRIAESQKRQS